MAFGTMIGQVAGLGLELAGTAIQAGEAKRVANILRNLPGYKPVDTTQEQAGAIEGNLGALPTASNLASQVNTFNVGETARRLQSLIPGYDKLSGTALKNIGDLLAGKIPDDVSKSVLRGAASKALGMGFGGSGMARNLAMRDIGKTSLEASQAGLESFQRWIGQQSAMTPAFDMTAMFLTPQQRVQTALVNANMSYQSAMNQAMGKTAPGASSVWGNYLKEKGSQMSAASGGMGGLMKSFGIGGG